MGRYYILIERERTRIYRKEDNGIPMSFTIDEKKVIELHNTLKINYDNDFIDYKPLEYSYNHNCVNVFEPESIICGFRMDFTVKMFFYIFGLFDLIGEDNPEMMFIISNSVIDSTSEFMYLEHKWYYKEVFEKNIKLLNDMLEKNMQFLKVIFIEHLVTGFTEFLRGETKEDILYIDDKISSHLSNEKNAFSNHSFSWNRAKRKKGSMISKNFDKFLKDEEDNVSIESSNNIRSFILDSVKNGEKLKTINIERRDENRIIDCEELLKNYKKDKKNALIALEEFINEEIKSNNTKVILNINNENRKKKIVDLLEKKELKIWDRFDQNTLMLKLFTYSDYINKYSNVLYRNRLAKECGRYGYDCEAFMHENYIFALSNCLNQKESDSLCKALGLKAVKAFVN